MREEFLHYIWKFKLFNTISLLTDNDEVIEILNVGLHNTDAGPDFFNGKVKIGDTIWAGNIEIHIQSSDWINHQHHFDKAYDNVILHVVYVNDKVICNTKGIPIPTLELKNLISPDILKKYNSLTRSNDWIPCGKQISIVDSFKLNSWLNRLLIERLERKTIEIEQALKINKNNWEATFYQFLFKYLGLTINAQPFELLSKNAPVKIINKHPQLSSIEALLFGQAGYLEDNIEDNYFNQLKKEYLFLKAKFKLESMDKSLWKLLRLRPANFPTIRIAQLAVLLHKETRLFSKIIEEQSINNLQSFLNVNASTYWDNHYQFGVVTKNTKVKKIGINTINNIIINVVVPFIFIYGKVKQDEEQVNNSLVLLESIKAESNTIIKNWQELGVYATNAMQTQSLLELKNNYCSQKKCLNCSIGNNILQK